MKKLAVVIALGVLGGLILILRRESSPVVSIPHISEPSKTYDEVSEVEAYVRAADIATLTGEQPVLGGSWRYTEVRVDSAVDRVVVTYEDGHIMGSGTISYTYDSQRNVVTVNGFTKTK